MIRTPTRQFGAAMVDPATSQLVHHRSRHLPFTVSADQDVWHVICVQVVVWRHLTLFPLVRDIIRLAPLP